MRRIGFMAVVLAGALVVGACGGATEDLGNAAQDLEDVADAVDQATDDGMGSDDGGTAEIVAVSLPEGWPADFPAPDGAIPTWERSGPAINNDTYLTWEVLYFSELADEDLMAFYDEALVAAGWTIDTRFTEDASGMPSFGFMVSKEDWSGTISIGDGGVGDAAGNIYVSLGHPSEG